jgi:1,2-diacylglycerol 3-alpha-glucosyltransferase
MNILLLNLILTTAENGIIKRRKTIKNCMISNFAMGFIASGHKVTIIAAEEYKPTEVEQYDFDIIFLKSLLPKIFKPDLIPYPKGLRRYLKQNIDKFDLVITSEAFAMATLLAADICKDKLVIWQEMSIHQHKFHRLPSKLWYNIIVPLFMRKTLIVPRSEPARNFIRHYSHNVSNEVVDHGANGNLLYPSDESDKTFIVISQLIERKNIDRIISKFAALVKDEQYSDYKLHIIGDGDKAEDLKRQVIDTGIADNVIFHGYMLHSEMAQYLRRAKAMLIDTSKDLNMVSIPEALVSGTPIVTNTQPARASYIKDKEIGIVNDNWDSEDLKEIIKNYERYHNACLAIRDELTNEGCAKKMVEIFLSSSFHN